MVDGKEKSQKKVEQEITNGNLGIYSTNFG